MLQGRMVRVSYLREAVFGALLNSSSLFFRKIRASGPVGRAVAHTERSIVMFGLAF
jgi:hypothetical protein